MNKFNILLELPVHVAAIVGMMSIPGAAALAKDELSSSAAWTASVEALAPLGEMGNRLSDPNDPQLQQELHRLLYSQVAIAYLGLLYADPRYPAFYPIYNQALNFLAPSPDHTYLTTPVDDDGVYRISGHRGTVRLVDFQIGSGTMLPKGVGPTGPTMSNYDLDTIDIKPDGTFELILSAERPEGYRGNWWKLEKGSTYIIVRQVAYDWLHEIDPRLAIERLDSIPAKPRDSAEKIALELQQIPRWVERWTRFAIDYVAQIRSAGTVNQVVHRDLGGVGGFSSKQVYLEGYFNLAPDEALIVETSVPRHCRFWNFQLTDELWASLDAMNRQTSLNGLTAKIDSDGKFRVVISERDPGVANWLDTVGYRRGLVFGRWNDCSDYPQPTTRKVKIAEVLGALPADTARVSASERADSIRLRRQGFQMRRRW